MNGEPRTDLIQLITQTESLSGDDDPAPNPADIDSSPLGDYPRVLRPSALELPLTMPDGA
jgi:hypothetical protein